MHPAWQGRSIAGPRLRLVEFTAFLEQQLQPDTDAVRNDNAKLNSTVARNTHMEWGKLELFA